MKGILASICALALLGVSSVSSLNDLYAHHHPDAVLNKNQVVNKNNPPQGNGRGGRGSYRPPSRNMYHHNPGRKSYRNGGNGNSRPPNRANYNNNGNDNGRPPNRASYGNGNGRASNRANYDNNRHKPRSAAPVQKLSYNEDGSIKWTNKMAATSEQGQSQQDYGQSYEQDQQQDDQSQYNGYYGDSNRYSNGNSNSNGYYSGSNNNYSGQSNSYSGSNQRSGQSNSYSGSNQGSNYYQEDQQQSSNQYYDDYSDNQNGYSGDDNGYGYSNNDNYGSSNNNDYGNSNSYDDDNSNNQSQNSANPKKNVSAGIVGRIRLAGALPDDGYNRGEGTFYDVETRVSSCGKQSENSELVAAVNSEQMGEDGRDNANCGKDIEVVGPSGKTIQVTVVDSCQTCKSGGLDLSPAAFEEIGDFSHNSVPIKWKFV